MDGTANLVLYAGYTLIGSIIYWLATGESPLATRPSICSYPTSESRQLSFPTLCRPIPIPIPTRFTLFRRHGWLCGLLHVCAKDLRHH